MVAVIKVTSFACNIRDGKHLNQPELLTPVWQKFAISKMPTPLEYLSFLFYFPTFLAGPAFHFTSYKEFIEGTLYVDKKHNPSGKEPSPIIPALIAFGEAILSIGVHIAFGKCAIGLILVSVSVHTFIRLFPMGPLLIPGGVDQLNIVTRIIYLILSGAGVRCQYYFAWKLSEGAGILSGLGYVHCALHCILVPDELFRFNGWTDKGKPLFDRLCNIYILKVEFAGSVRDLTIVRFLQLCILLLRAH
jgi:lysophospholipid acyltransferase